MSEIRRTTCGYDHVTALRTIGVVAGGYELAAGIADELEALRAENTRLRAALREIAADARVMLSEMDCGECEYGLDDIVRAAEALGEVRDDER